MNAAAAMQLQRAPGEAMQEDGFFPGKKPVQSVGRGYGNPQLNRVLPFVWAFAGESTTREQPAGATPLARAGLPNRRVEPEMAFYRRYTEAMLGRYVRMSMEAGKVPSLLGQEMFRGNVTSYRVESFEDVVIFLHDVDRCLEKLDPEQQYLISRIALQEYTLLETAAMMRLDPRTVVRRYARAIDRLTRVFLSVKMLHLQNDVKGSETENCD